MLIYDGGTGTWEEMTRSLGVEPSGGGTGSVGAS
jgi:hypothetical protein